MIWPPAYSFPARGRMVAQPAPTAEQLLRAPQAWIRYRASYAVGGGSYWDSRELGPKPLKWWLCRAWWVLAYQLAQWWATASPEKESGPSLASMSKKPAEICAGDAGGDMGGLSNVSGAPNLESHMAASGALREGLKSDFKTTVMDGLRGGHFPI